MAPATATSTPPSATNEAWTGGPRGAAVGLAGLATVEAAPPAAPALALAREADAKALFIGEAVLQRFCCRFLW
jgi:hypothetical protein